MERGEGDGETKLEKNRLRGHLELEGPLEFLDRVPHLCAYYPLHITCIFYPLETLSDPWACTLCVRACAGISTELLCVCLQLT